MKIFGMRTGQIGDIIMSLPLLDYFEKKYSQSYKYFSISKKYKQIIPLLINHPLISEIKVTDNDDSYGESDFDIIRQCDIVINTTPPHSDPFWYNTKSCIQETADMAGISHEEITTIPMLYNPFPLETENYISIWPFAGYSDLTNGRSPSLNWWNELLSKFTSLTIFHFGSNNEPNLTVGQHNKYYRFTNLSFSEQIRISLNGRLILGTDSGSMWCTAAYQQVPQINMLTNWFPNHVSNPFALSPIGVKSKSLFAKNGCDNILHEEVKNNIHEILSLR
jgi:ADP-heptose:LPS heptosyltransferase